MKTFLFNIHPVISESIELKALVSNVKVFLRFKSISKAVVFQNLELSRRLSSTCPLALRPIVRLTKGRWTSEQGTKGKWDKEKKEGNWSRKGNNTSELILSIGEQTNGGLSALLPPKLTGSRQQRCSLSLAALEDSLKFLRLKSHSARANCETIEIMPCEYLRGRWKLRGVEIFRKASDRELCQGL